AVEALVPLGELRIEAGGLADELALVVVRRGGGGAAGSEDDDSRAIFAELRGELEAILGAVHEDAVGQVDVDADGDAEDFACGLGFGAAGFGAAARRRLPARQVEDADGIALRHELGQRSAAQNFEVVRMRGDGNDIESVRQGFGAHGGSPRNSEPLGYEPRRWRRAIRSQDSALPFGSRLIWLISSSFWG